MVLALMPHSNPSDPKKREPILLRALKSLYIQVIVGIILGCLVGYFSPKTGIALEPIGKGFVNLVKMLIAPIIFLTIVAGIGSLGDLRKVGRVGLKAIVYFEIVTTLALAIGLIVVNLVQPGVGMNAHPGAAAGEAKSHSTVEFILNIIPTTFVSAFTSGEILQVLLVAILFGSALSLMKEQRNHLVHLIDAASHAFMKIVGIIMKLAPLAAFGAMAFTVGKLGIEKLAQLLGLLACVYLTCIAFIFIVLGLIMRSIGFSLFKFLRYIREEILLVLGTSSSESALPRMLIKMEKLGCEKSVVGLVLPTGYSFNLDGTSIYLTMSAIFIAQATNTPLTLWQQLAILGLLLLTSKGAAAVTGGGLVTLSATLTSIKTVPAAGVDLIFGIDRFMSEARAITNLIGNGVATLFIANWEKALNREHAIAVLNDPGAHDIGE